MSLLGLHGPRFQGVVVNLLPDDLGQGCEIWPLNFLSQPYQGKRLLVVKDVIIELLLNCIWGPNIDILHIYEREQTQHIERQ